MELIHITGGHHKDSILKEGLKTREQGAINEGNRKSTEEEYIKIETYEDVKLLDIEELLEEHKPKHLKEYISLNNCVFFTEINDYKNHWEKHYGIPYAVFSFLAGFKIDIKKLDTDKLYLLNSDTRILYDLAEVVVRISRKKRDGYSDFMIERWDLSDLSKEYWNQLIPYKEYIENPDKYEIPNTWPYCFEYMYFDNVPSDILELINDCNY